MTVFTEQALLERLKENLKLIMDGVSIASQYDTDGTPNLRITRNGDAIQVRMEMRGNADRVNSLGMAQQAYSPHQALIVQGFNLPQSFSTVVTDWETGETVQPYVNGVAVGSPVAFNTNNNTSAADLATAIATSPLIASSSATTGTITTTSRNGIHITLTFVAAGGDSVGLATTETYGSDWDMRDKVLAMTQFLGAKTRVYAIGTVPATWSLSGATLVAEIPSDKIWKLNLSA